MMIYIPVLISVIVIQNMIVRLGGMDIEMICTEEKIQDKM